MKTTSAGKDLAVSGRKKPVGEKRVLPARALGAGSFQRNRLGYACVPSQVGFFGQIATNGKKGIRLGMLISVSLAGGDGGGAAPGCCAGELRRGRGGREVRTSRQELCQGDVGPLVQPEVGLVAEGLAGLAGVGAADGAGHHAAPAGAPHAGEDVLKDQAGSGVNA